MTTVKGKGLGKGQVKGLVKGLVKAKVLVPVANKHIVVNSRETATDLLRELGKNPVCMLFHATWCRHCTDFKPIWNAFVAKMVKRKTSQPVFAECEFTYKTYFDNQQQYKDLFNVRVVPMVKFYNPKTNKTVEFSSQLSTLESFIEANHKSGLAKVKVPVVTKKPAVPVTRPVVRANGANGANGVKPTIPKAKAKAKTQK